MRQRPLVVAVAALFLAAGAAHAVPATDRASAAQAVPADALSESRRLNELVEACFEDYLRLNPVSATSEARRVAETERYMAIPGQALAYKLGQLKISELRARAEKTLGDRFDPRKFHTAVLGDGPLPLDVLEAKVDRWIASQKGG